MVNVKELKDNDLGCFARMTITAKVLPKNPQNKKLIDTYGTNSQEMLLCLGGLGLDHGFITIKAKPTMKDSQFHKNLGFNLYDIIQATGIIEERERNNRDSGISYDRTLRIVEADNVKVIKEIKVDGTKVELESVSRIKGVIDSIENDELVIAIVPKDIDKHRVKYIHMTMSNDNEDCQWIKENLVVGDMVFVLGEHFNKVVKDQNSDNVVSRINELKVTKVVGYKKIG